MYISSSEDFFILLLSEGESCHLAEAPAWNTGDLGLFQLFIRLCGQGSRRRLYIQLTREKNLARVYLRKLCTDRFLFQTFFTSFFILLTANYPMLLLCCKSRSAMQAAYQCSLCTAGILHVLAPARGVFFPFNSFTALARLSDLLDFGGDIEKDELFLHILTSRRKRMQMLLVDHSPSLSYVFSYAEVSHGFTKKTEYWPVL